MQALDLSQESISTLLCYLELLPEQIVKVLPPAYTVCSVQSFGGAKPLQQAAQKVFVTGQVFFTFSSAFQNG